MQLPSRFAGRFLPFLMAAVPLALPLGASAQENTAAFVQNAYAAVGLSPSCSQISLESEAIYSQQSNMAREQEAARFVRSLFEIPNGSTTQTLLYSIRNPVSDTRPVRDQEFVNDLFAAYLQRPADSGGFSFWVNALQQYPSRAVGRDALLTAFADSAEFKSLVDNLAFGPVTCNVSCPPGFTQTQFLCEAN